MNSTLKEVVASTLGISTADINSELSRENCDSWDSLKHLTLITAIEETFAVKLTMTEIMEIRNVGDLEEILRAYAEI